PRTEIRRIRPRCPTSAQRTRHWAFFGPFVLPTRPFGLLCSSFGAPLNPFIPAVRHGTSVRRLLSELKVAQELRITAGSRTTSERSVFWASFYRLLPYI